MIKRNEKQLSSLSAYAPTTNAARNAMRQPAQQSRLLHGWYKARKAASESAYLSDHAVFVAVVIVIVVV